MQNIVISGNLGKDAESRLAGNDEVCSFSVGVKQGWGDKASTNWYRCNVWGKRGQKIREYLIKGVKVFVTGELTIGEYNGKPQFDVRVEQIEWDKPASQPTGRQGAPAQQSRDPLGDDEFIPFITHGGTFAS